MAVLCNMLFLNVSQRCVHVLMHAGAALLYRAGRPLNSWLDAEGRSADVLKAKVLGRRSGNDPELTDSSGFGWVREQDLWTPHHFGVMYLHISIEKFFLTKVLQSLWFNEGGSAAHGAIADR